MEDDEIKAGSEPLHGAPTPGISVQQSAIPGPSSSKSMPDRATTNPLFGATPSPPPIGISSRSSPPTIPDRQRLPLHHPSTLPSYLRKLSYILSIILGSSAVITGVWSLIVLPLLHASFSARKALVDQQSDRWTSIVGTLRQIKANGMYIQSRPVSDGFQEEGEEQNKSVGEGSEQGPGEMARLTHHEEDTSMETSESLIPITKISSLSTSLSNLLSAFNSTSTTRTSLLSTVESYSSYLHRQVYRRSQPFSTASSAGINTSGYSLGTLSANLAKAGGSTSSNQRRPFDIYGQQEDGDDQEVRLEDMGVKSEEWDAVRKEVRAIKGMLLSRRNFVSQDSEVR